MTEREPPTDRTRVRRLPERGAYDRATIDAILDAMPVAHVGYSIDGQPFVTPTLQWREGDHVYWHGSAASRMLRVIDGAPVCLTVTLIDGMVLARSAFNHSMNYRSVMLLGKAHAVTDPAVKEARLRTFVESQFPGRWDMLRPVTAQELKGTTVLGMPIDECSAKIRSGRAPRRRGGRGPRHLGRRHPDPLRGPAAHRRRPRARRPEGSARTISASAIPGPPRLTRLPRPTRLPLDSLQELP